jgi:histidyl-tRNA synthetase
MYSFETQGGEHLTLRPELTAPVMRAYVEHSMHKTGAFRKFYYLGGLFRYERAQKGRWRQFSQFGVEAIGSDSPLADVETLVLGWDILCACGVPGLSLSLNSIGCGACRPGYRDALKRHVTARANLLCEDCRSRVERNVLRVLDCKRPECKAALGDVPAATDYLCRDCASHFEAVRDGAGRHIPSWTVDSSLVRGLDYYTRTVYEFAAGELGAQNAVGGGGRYDGLIAALGGPQTPSVGFALGLDRIVLSLLPGTGGAKTPAQASLYVVSVAEDMNVPAQALVVRLRRAGFAANMDYERRSVKAQLRAADRSGARFVAILGPEEAARNALQLKDLHSGQQREIRQDEIIEYLGQAQKGSS